MKRIKLMLILFAFIPMKSICQHQKKLNLGGGYFGQDITSPGVVLEFEFERYVTEKFSSSSRADLTSFITEDYWSIGLELHKGWRKYHKSGLFFEQSLGLGILHSTYTIDHVVYVDQFNNGYPYGPGLNLGFMPSVTLGLGVDLTHKKESQNLIWLRPKAYWNFAYRDFSEPFFAVQLGYTYTLKNLTK